MSDPTNSTGPIDQAAEALAEADARMVASMVQSAEWDMARGDVDFWVRHIAGLRAAEARAKAERQTCDHCGAVIGRAKDPAP